MDRLDGAGARIAEMEAKQRVIESESKELFRPWIGGWEYSFGGGKEDHDGTLTIETSGDELEGAFDGSIIGQLSDIRTINQGRGIEGAWENDSGQSGRFEFRLAEDGQSFTGNYSMGDKPIVPSSNTWVGRRPDDQ